MPHPLHSERDGAKFAQVELWGQAIGALLVSNGDSPALSRAGVLSAESQGEPARSRTRRLFALLAEALRGSNRDLTSGPLAPAVFVLAVPMALEMVGESIFAVVDALFIARLGAPALASAGITETALELVYAVAIGFSFAVTAVVSRRCGEGDRRGAARAGVQLIKTGYGGWTLAVVRRGAQRFR